MEWDLSVLYSAPDDPRVDEHISQISKQVEKLVGYKGKLVKSSPEKISQFLDQYEDYLVEVAVLRNYPSLMVSADQSNSEAKALNNRVTNEFSNWHKQLAFISLELGKNIQNNPGYLNEQVLANRKYYLQRIAQNYSHKLSETEEVLNIEKDRFGVSEWYKLQQELVGTTKYSIEIDGKSEEYSWSAGHGLLSHKGRSVRKAAVKGLFNGLGDKGEIYAYALRNVCGNYTTMSKKRKYDNYMESSFFSSHLSKDIVDAMFEVVMENVDVFQEFLLLKARLLGNEKLPGEDLYAPYPFSDDREIEWDEAKNIVVDGFTDFDPEFGEIASDMFAKNRVDGKPRDGKRAGAFCSTWFKGQSAFIMLSYNDNMESVGTLAHEMGHAVHAYYITRNQNYLHSNMGMPLAETASEFGSLLFNLKFQDEAKTEEQQKSVLFNMVENFMIAIFEVGSRTLFEQLLYQALDNNEFLNEEKINELYWEARKRVFGDVVEWMPEQVYEWCWKPHYYIPSFRFYNYPYVFGEFSVLSMYAAYRKDKKKFTQNYKEFLKAGGSRVPEKMIMDLFGLDLTSKSFWQDGMNELREFVNRCKSSVEPDKVTQHN